MGNEQGRGSHPLLSAEFVLVGVLVVALLLAMLMIFAFVSGGGDIAAVQTNRKDLLAIILGAFGAWIGAGAAYFFGRENLRAATESMLRMRDVSPEERLMQTSLRDVKPRPLPITFTREDNLDRVLQWLDEDPERFFVVVLDKQGKIDKAVDEEAIYRYLHKKNPPPEERTLGHVIDHVKGEVEQLEKAGKRDAAKAAATMVDAAVLLDDAQTAWLASEMMERERKFVTIVVDAKGSPVGYITTGDIRRLILSPAR